MSMTYTPSTEIAQIGIRLMDHAYMAWLGAESECERALRAWVDGPPRNHAAMYLSYRAALDREEAAARDLQRLSELAARSRIARRMTFIPAPELGEIGIPLLDDAYIAWFGAGCDCKQRFH
jgi:hypothetical protein